MIPDTKGRVAQVNGESGSAAFGISARDTAHIMTVLRSAIYTDKIAAVLREYASNAWDAHRDAGLDAVPIRVTLPTDARLELEIRDFGLGLSREDVFELFTQYGASTKRSSDRCVGMLGIGSKSGFAYSDSFTIVSHHAGVASTYVALLGADERGEVKLMHEQPTQETGLSIRIGVQKKDVKAFEDRAKKLFQHFEPRPVINCELPVTPAECCMPMGTINSVNEHRAQEWTAVMGCVGYRVNMNQLKVPDYVRQAVATLKFGIGELAISASREELKYTEETVAKLEARACELIDEYVSQKLAAIESAATSDWDRRLLIQELSRLSLDALTKTMPKLTSSTVLLPKLTRVLFKRALSRKKADAASAMVKEPEPALSVSRHARIIVRDDKRAISGFRLHPAEHMVFLAPDVTLVEALEELRDALASVQCAGFPIILSSDVTEWVAPPKKQREERLKSAKHSCKLFSLNSTASSPTGAPPSSRWDIVDHVPSDADVYVELRAFRDKKALSTGEELDLYDAIEADAKLLESLGASFPKIIGYKVLKRDVPAPKRPGQSYWDWREDIIARALERDRGAAPSVREKLLGARIATSTREMTYGSNLRVTDADMNRLEKKLGADHAITRVFSSLAIGAKTLADMGYHNRNKLLELLQTSPAGKQLMKEADDVVKSLTDRWPLLRCQSEGIGALIGQHSVEWIAYVAR